MKKIRYAVIGISGVGNSHIKFIRGNPDATLIAIVDSNEETLNKKGAELGVKVFTDYRDLLKNNLVDAVSICTPHNLHYKMTMDCLDAGIHVLVEKPLANTVSEADKIIQKAKEKELIVSVGHQYRTHRSSQIIKNIIDSGRIGKIMRVLWSWSSFRPETYYKNKPWHATWEESGAGVLMNQVSHDLDLICWLIGKPTEVNAMIGNQLHSAEIEDIACANILFENGAHGSFQFSINQPQAFSVRQIIGEKGAIFFNDVKSLMNDMNDEITLCIYEDDVNNIINEKWNPTINVETGKLLDLKKKKPYKKLRKKIRAQIERKVRNYLNPPEKVSWLNWNNPIGHKALINNFIESIVNNSKPMIDMESTHTTVELINAIILSAMKKRNVSLPVNRIEYNELFNELSSGEIKVPRYRN